MRLPRLLASLSAALLLAAGAAATPIVPNADLSGTVHDGENHAGATGDDSLFIGASFVSATLSSNAFASSFMNADFTAADFTGAVLRNGDFSGAVFTGATFSATQMRDGNFTNAVFDGVVLNGQVRGANFSGASFLGADLSAATNWDLATWAGAAFDASTVFAPGFDPAAEGMVFVAEPRAATLLGLGLLGLGLFGSRRAA